MTDDGTSTAQADNVKVAKGRPCLPDRERSGSGWRPQRRQRAETTGHQLSDSSLGRRGVAIPHSVLRRAIELAREPADPCHISPAVLRELQGWRFYDRLRSAEANERLRTNKVLRNAIDRLCTPLLDRMHHGSSRADAERSLCAIGRAVGGLTATLPLVAELPRANQQRAAVSELLWCLRHAVAEADRGKRGQRARLSVDLDLWRLLCVGFAAAQSSLDVRFRLHQPSSWEEARPALREACGAFCATAEARLGAESELFASNDHWIGDDLATLSQIADRLDPYLVALLGADAALQGIPADIERGTARIVRKAQATGLGPATLADILIGQWCGIGGESVRQERLRAGVTVETTALPTVESSSRLGTVDHPAELPPERPVANVAEATARLVEEISCWRLAPPLKSKRARDRLRGSREVEGAIQRLRAPLDGGGDTDCRPVRDERGARAVVRALRRLLRELQAVRRLPRASDQERKARQLLRELRETVEKADSRPRGRKQPV